MKTITIEIINDKAINLLEDLEALNLIKIVKNDSTNKRPKPSDYFEILSFEDGLDRLSNLGK
ncbi:MAG: hypothetical protein Q8R57_10145 [Bacteroidota bacterium]|nr:hypothetical protein [Bacteroidota bacterium]